MSAVHGDEVYRPASGATLPRAPKQERSRRTQGQLLAAAEGLAVVPTLEPVRAALQDGGDVAPAMRATVRAVLEHTASVPWLVCSWNQLVLTAVLLDEPPA